MTKTTQSPWVTRAFKAELPAKEYSQSPAHIHIIAAVAQAAQEIAIQKRVAEIRSL